HKGKAGASVRADRAHGGYQAAGGRLTEEATGRVVAAAALTRPTSTTVVARVGDGGTRECRKTGPSAPSRDPGFDNHGCAPTRIEVTALCASTAAAVDPF